MPIKNKTPKENHIYVQSVALCGLLTAVMMVLGYVESRIPVLVGVPGIKLGLANSVLVYAVYLLSPRVTVGLMLVKVVLSALLFASPLAMAFSLTGGVLSTAGMLLAKRMKGFGMVGVSVIGALLHNAGQVLVAVWLVGNVNLLYYLAILALTAVVTGMVTGLCAGLVMKALGKH